MVSHSRWEKGGTGMKSRIKISFLMHIG